MCDSGSGLASTWTPAIHRGAARHTYTPACDGFHPPGPCPETGTAARIQWHRDDIREQPGPEQEDGS